jgi:hypothetical protein
MSDFLQIGITSQRTATCQLLYQKHPTTFASHPDSRLGSGTECPFRTSTSELDGNFGRGAQLLRRAQTAAGYMSSQNGLGPT